METPNFDFKSPLGKIKQDLEKFKNTKVKCAIIGRSGTGKSSLINAIAGEEIAEVGEVETTMSINEPIEYNGLLMYDLPGCGTSNFPKEDYLKTFGLEQFDCLILVTADRFYEDDLFLIDELTKLKKPVFTTRTKIDFSIDRAKRRGVSEKETYDNIFNNLKKELEGYRVKGIYLTSADYPRKYDLGKLLEDISSSLETLKRDRFIADVNITSKKILLEKNGVAKKIVSKYSALAAANGINPVIGLDIAVDLGLITKMSFEVKNIYGFSKEQQEYIEPLIGKKNIKLLSAKILQYTTRYGGKEAIMVLLKKGSVMLATKSFAKWIPFVGQAIAAGIGFKMTSSIGSDMINDAEVIAKEAFDSFKSLD